MTALRILSLSGKNMSDLVPANGDPSDAAVCRARLLAALIADIDPDIVGLVEAPASQERTERYVATYLDGAYTARCAEKRGLLGLRCWCGRHWALPSASARRSRAAWTSRCRSSTPTVTASARSTRGQPGAARGGVVGGSVWQPDRVFTTTHADHPERTRWTIDFADRILNPLADSRYGQPTEMRSWIDHILVSPALRGSIVAGTAQIAHRRPAAPGLPAAQARPRGTDHHPPYVTLEL